MFNNIIHDLKSNINIKPHCPKCSKLVNIVFLIRTFQDSVILTGTKDLWNNSLNSSLWLQGSVAKTE